MPISSQSTYNLGINGINTRNLGINGGGISHILMLEFNSSGSVYFTTYQATGNALTMGLRYSILKIA